MANKRKRHAGGSRTPAIPPAAARLPHHPVPDVTADVDHYDEAIHAFQKRLPVSRDEWEEMNAGERRRSFNVAGVAQADMVTDVWEAIDRAIRDGKDFEEFRGEVLPTVTEAWGGEIPGRIDNIFRTNVMTAYNDGRYSVFSAPAVKEARPFFRFDAIDDDRVDDECLDLNGTVLEQDDAFWNRNTPPLHFQCRCTITALSKDEADDEGVDEAPDIQHSADGFGARPDTEGEDWKPDLEKYPDPIAEVLRVKLEG
jgi:SPP1 gp7 family putative phage head morphogenesis protein